MSEYSSWICNRFLFARLGTVVIFGAYQERDVGHVLGIEENRISFPDRAQFTLPAGLAA